MSETVGAYQIAAFTSPVDGEVQSASVVLGNDNTVRTGFNNHDLDSGLHFQSSALSQRPAAGTSGRKWFTTDGRRIYYDTGSAWVEAAYLPTTGGSVGGNVAITGDLAVTGAITGAIAASQITSGTLAVARGGTGVDGSAAGNGNLLIGNGAGFTLAALTAGAGIAITNGAGTITIATTAEVSGSGTAGKLAKFSAAQAIVDSIIEESADGIEIGGQAAAAIASLGDSGAAVAIDWRDGNGQAVSLTGNAVFTFANPVAGAWYTVLLIGDGTQRTPTWPGDVRWAGGSAPTPTATSGKYTTVMFYYTGFIYLGFVAGLNA